ncbi:MAG: hypothetical protein WED09_11565 [Homoserinimonas sp.]
MFLSNSTKRATAAFTRDDRGSAMVSVIGVMSVLAIISVTVLSATMNAMGTTSSTRAGVQATAAAEAGIDVATVGLQTINDCASVSGVYASPAGTHPQFNAVIAFDEGAGWVTGCPTDDADLVRITSTGTAESVGIAGATAGDEVTLEAIYTYVPIIIQVPKVGSAVYAHEIHGTLKKFELNYAENSVATSVSIKNGDVVCSNGANIGGDLILGNGSASLDMCDVDGEVHVSGNATINKSEIGRDVTAGGTATVTDSTVGGVVTSGGLAPVIPDWVDVTDDPAYWVAQGYTVVDWVGACSISKNNSPWENLSSYTSPTVINFISACPNTPVSTSNSMNSVEVNANLVFIAEEFAFDKLILTEAEAEVDRTVTFLVPDRTPDSLPTCAPPAGLDGGITLTNETDFTDNISSMVYTPCKVYSDRNGFRGQIYGGDVEFGQQASLEFDEVGIAGADLTGGVTVPQQSGAELGAPVSLREVG